MSVNGHDSDSGEPVSFFEDLKARVRDTVSISSVDSEPIAPHSAKRDDDGGVASSADDEVDEDEDVGVPGTGGGAARRELHPVTALGVSTHDAIAGVTDADCKVPVVQLSEAPVAQLSSVSAPQRTLIAEGCDETVALDVGTHLCLADGTLVGVVASTFGPVRRAFYVLASPLSTSDLDALHQSGELQEATSLHMDLAHQTMIFDPMTQCDVANGTDASYINDEELPENVRPDFSDDEKELSWKRQRRLKRSRSESISSDDAPEEIEWSHIDLEDPAPVAVTHAQTAPTQEGPSGECAPGLVVPQWLQK